MVARKQIASVAAALALAWAMPASAIVVWTGTGTTDENGTTVHAEADFSLSGSDLSVTLTNTGAATTAQGDTLTGVIFSINGDQTLSFDMVGPVCGQTLGPGSEIWTDKTAGSNNTTDPLCGSWTSQLASPPKFPAEFGVATTGYGGEFNGGSITLGNASPDYGIVGANTFPRNAFGGAQFPFIQNSLVFNFAVTSGSFTESDITGVAFLFGTRGTSVITGECLAGCIPIIVPEPGSLALLGIAGVALGWISRRRA
jgi:hypothetical protein